MNEVTLPKTNVYKVPSSEELISFITSNSYAMQQKLDGRRMIAVKQQRGGGNVTAYGKDHQLFIPPQHVINSLQMLPDEPWLLDGELCKDGYHIFDLIEAPKPEVKSKSFDDRYLMLKAMLNVWDATNVYTVPTWYDPKEKFFSLIRLRDMQAEGVVFRPRQYSAHFHGAVYKYKFYNTVDCIVLNKRVEGRRTIEIAVLDNQDYHYLGNVKCEFDVQDQMTVDQVVEVRYRKISKSGKLIEPVFVRLRWNKPAYRCTSEQILTVPDATVLTNTRHDTALIRAAEILGIEWEDALQLIDNTADDE